MTTLSEIARLLDAELIGADGTVAGFATDSRRLNPGELFVALKGPNFDGHHFVAAARERGACGALVERALAVELPQVRVPDARLALGRLGATWRARFSRPLIALTGSNGKTTVKEMIRSILEQKGAVLATRGNLNNDVGLPLTLLRLSGNYRYAVIEMGANHSGEIAYLTGLARPDVALITNAGPAHLEGFGDLDGVARAKGEIFQGLAENGTAIVNRDDPYSDYWSGLVGRRRCVGFGLERPAEVQGERLDEISGRFRLSVAGAGTEVVLPLPGRHNVRNALAAAAAAWAVGATLEDLCRGLESARGVAGRLQVRQGRGGETIIDDTYNANPGSLDAAMVTVAARGGVRWLVLGDMAELGPEASELHARAGRRARALGFERLYALGPHARRAALAFGAGGGHFESAEALIEALDVALQKVSGRPALLVKGSRSMRMERIVQALTETRPAALEGHGRC